MQDDTSVPPRASVERHPGGLCLDGTLRPAHRPDGLCPQGDEQAATGGGASDQARRRKIRFAIWAAISLGVGLFLGYAIDAPQGFSASSGTYADKVRTTWNSVSNATDYIVYRNTLNDFFSGTTLATTNSTSYDDTTAAAGTIYYYWVAAWDAVLGQVALSAPDTGWRHSSWSLAAGDYDGDGLADPATYNPTNATFTVQVSGSGYSNTVTETQIGGADYVAATADYDGDGIADPAVYSEATGTWVVRLSTAADGSADSTFTALLGGQGWGAAAADYDGDGLADPAVYREETGDWMALLSKYDYFQVKQSVFLGGPGWAVAVADYDGDGQADPAVYHEATGDWMASLSDYDYVQVKLPGLLGGPGWTPVPADYDGDGNADPAIYNGATGELRVLLSDSDYEFLSKALN